MHLYGVFLPTFFDGSDLGRDVAAAFCTPLAVRASVPKPPSSYTLGRKTIQLRSSYFADASTAEAI